MDVCIVGVSSTLMWALPGLLSRAGFSVDVVTTSHLLRASRFVRTVHHADTLDAVVEQAYELICARAQPYDWVVACDDETLRQLSRLDWPNESAPKYLPRQRKGQLTHIYSKFGLSQMLQAGGVRTPAFRLVASCAEAVAAAQELGYPVLMKTDSDSGGVGVSVCLNEEDVWKLEVRLEAQPMLVQRLIEGRELDLSAIYFDQKLVHFSYAVIERRIASSAALSAVRRYYPLSLADAEVFDELAALGRALDAQGFVSISCIEAADGSGRYYFEADMRPNVWVDVSRLYGEDAALRIHDWFAQGRALCRACLPAAEGRTPMLIPHFQRIGWWELLVNRYGVWRSIPWSESSIVVRLLASRAVMPVARTLTPTRLRQAVKRTLIAGGVAFP